MSAGQPPLPPDEDLRLRALASYGVLDTPAEPAYDEIAREVARLLGTPIAMVSLVDRDRQWSKASVGLAPRETPRHVSFCAHALLGTEPLVVPDTLADERFAASPLVTSDPSIRFYAGAPLVTPEGHVLGTLCVMDREPRVLRAGESDRLRFLARQVVAHLELRRQAAELARATADRERADARIHRTEARVRRTEARLATLFDGIRDYAIVMLDPDGHVVTWNAGAGRLHRVAAGEVLGEPMSALVPGVEAGAAAPDALLETAAGAGRAEGEGWWLRRDGTRFWANTVVTALRDDAGRLLGFTWICRDLTERREVEETRTRLLAREAEARAEGEAARRAAFLAEASRELAASLDHGTTLSAVARLAVGALAEWCVVDVAGPEGALERLAAAHADPALEPLVRKLADHGPDRVRTHPILRVLATGRAELMAEVTDETIAAAASDPRHLDLLRVLAPRSCMIVPMTARGRTLGVLSFVRGPSGPPYGPSDLALAGDLAQRAALAVDNARLYREARVAEARFRRLVDSNLIGIMLADLRGTILEANDAFLRMVGYSREDLRSGLVRWTSMTPPEYAAVSARAVEELRTTGACTPFENVYVRADGSRVPVVVGAARLDGGSEECVAFVLDLTERARAEEAVRALNDALERRVVQRTAELTAANQDLEAFAYSVSHDLRAPLRAIDAFGRILAEDYGARLGDEARALLDRMRGAARRMSQLIDDLLGLSRVTRWQLERAPVDLGAVAREVAAGLAESGLGRKVEVRVAPGLTATADRRLVRILLDNLIGNAFKFTRGRPDAHVEVGRCGTDDEPVFFVRDDGVGFDAAYADRLFRPFQRLHRQDEFEGSGIGLATVSRIVQRHGGRVWAEGAVGRGAVVYFTLAPPGAPVPARTA